MTVARLGERGVIRRIVERLGPIAPASGRLIAGPGDDAALIEPAAGRLLVATADLLIEAVHFRREWSPPALLGHKALAVNLSDLAAMGALPIAFLLELGLPGDWPEADLDGFLDGMGALARREGIAPAGGDTVTSERLHVGITALGAVEPGRVLRRSGGRPGDRLAVSGPLGASSAGLRLLEQGWRLRTDGEAVPPRAGSSRDLPRAVAGRLLRAHLAPCVDLAAGQALAGWASAGLDLSDGLSQDLHNLCEASKCGAVIDAALLPLDPDARAAFALLALDPEIAGLEGGEDYKLLVAVPAAAGDPPAGCALTVVGELSEERLGIHLLRGGGAEPLPRRGFEHFPGP
jgi:thiamine-monophosphate kinase